MISVIMGDYNAEKTVLRAAESILAEQEELELILIDDASTDGTPDVLGALKERDARVLLLRNDQNRGLAYSLNAGLHVARGEFIARMDADDFSHAGRLAAQKKFLEENPSYAFVGSAANLAEQGKIYGRRSFPAAPDEKELIRRCPFIHPSLMFRAEALKRGASSGMMTFTRAVFRLYKDGFITLDDANATVSNRDELQLMLKYCCFFLSRLTLLLSHCLHIFIVTFKHNLHLFKIIRRTLILLKGVYHNL